MSGTKATQSGAKEGKKRGRRKKERDYHPSMGGVGTEERGNIRTFIPVKVSKMNEKGD